MRLEKHTPNKQVRQAIDQLESKHYWDLKGKAAITNSYSMARYTATKQRSIRFDRYNLNTDGQLHAKPPVDYKRETDARKAAPYLIGMEIEIIGSEQNDSGLADTLNKCLPASHYVCRDGSLHSGHGYEIVTAPRSLSEIKQSYLHYYNLLNTLARQGFTSHDNKQCGLHVHISRKALEDKQWIKLRNFVNRNKTAFKLLSRRTDSQIESFCSFSASHSRYTAVNICNNTTEFRFFRGTLKPATFFASLEILISIVEMFRTSKITSWKHWIKTLRSNSAYKYAWLYVQDTLPADLIQRSSVALSAEEKLARKQAREAKRQAKLAVLQSELNNLVEYAYTRTQTPYQGSKALDRSLSEAAIKVKPVPVYLSCNYRRELYQLSRSTLPSVRLAYVPSTMSDEQIANLHVYIGRSRGWGSDRRYVSVRTNPPVNY